MNSVREILEAIRTLPRPDRLRLAEELTQQLREETSGSMDPEPPPGSPLELRDGFYVYTGPIEGDAFDHRLDRDERVAQLMARVDADRH
jgi:hypothetical protein